MYITQRLRRFGTSIFTEVSAAASEAGAINLGQGFPDFDGPDFVKDAARKAVAEGPNQYAPMGGYPELNRAIAARYEREQGVSVDPLE